MDVVHSSLFSSSTTSGGRGHDGGGVVPIGGGVGISLAAALTGAPHPGISRRLLASSEGMSRGQGSMIPGGLTSEGRAGRGNGHHPPAVASSASAGSHSHSHSQRQSSSSLSSQLQAPWGVVAPRDTFAIVEHAKTRWLHVTEIAHLLTPEITPLPVSTTPPAAPPPSGSLFLYDRTKCKKYRDDGYEWVRKRSNAKKVREDHVKLRLGGKFRVSGCYAHSSNVKSMHRRTYHLLNVAADDDAQTTGASGGGGSSNRGSGSTSGVGNNWQNDLVLVHYLDTARAQRAPASVAMTMSGPRKEAECGDAVGREGRSIVEGKNFPKQAHASNGGSMKGDGLSRFGTESSRRGVVAEVSVAQSLLNLGVPSKERERVATSASGSLGDPHARKRPSSLDQECLPNETSGTYDECRQRRLPPKKGYMRNSLGKDGRSCSSSSSVEAKSEEFTIDQGRTSSVAKRSLTDQVLSPDGSPHVHPRPPSSSDASAGRSRSHDSLADLPSIQENRGAGGLLPAIVDLNPDVVTTPRSSADSNTEVTVVLSGSAPQDSFWGRFAAFVEFLVADAAGPNGGTRKQLMVRDVSLSRITELSPQAFKCPIPPGMVRQGYRKVILVGVPASLAAKFLDSAELASIVAITLEAKCNLDSGIAIDPVRGCVRSNFVTPAGSGAGIEFLSQISDNFFSVVSSTSASASASPSIVPHSSSAAAAASPFGFGIRGELVESRVGRTFSAPPGESQASLAASLSSPPFAAESTPLSAAMAAAHGSFGPPHHRLPPGVGINPRDVSAIARQGASMPSSSAVAAASANRDMVVSALTPWLIEPRRFDEHDEKNERRTMSFQEMAAALQDVHGGTPAAQRRVLSARTRHTGVSDYEILMLDNAISQIPTYRTQALRRAQAANLVTREMKTLFILTNQSLDPSVAADKLCLHWDLRLKIFGEERAFLPLTLGGALLDDMQAFTEVDLVHFLPGIEDTFGRAILYSNAYKYVRSLHDRRSVLRAAWYMYSAAAYECSDPQAGVVFVINMSNHGLENMDKELAEEVYNMMSLFPMIIRAHHYINVPWFQNFVWPVVRYIMGREMRCREIFHSGSTQVVLASLTKCGILPRMLPSDMGGSLNFDLAGWLRSRLQNGQ